MEPGTSYDERDWGEGELGPQGSALGMATDQFAELMSKIQESQARLHDELSVFKEEVRQGQEEAATKAIERARYEKPYQYKRKGNEEQAAFNPRVDEALAKIQLELPEARTTPALECTHKALERGRRLIAEKQKFIPIADRSELG